jgi:type IV pilus assembly protein PilM
VFPLRPGGDERAVEGDDVQPELDRTTLDRLSAYASDDVVEPGPPSSPADQFAVEEGRAVEQTSMTQESSYEVGEEESSSASYEHEPAGTGGFGRPSPEASGRSDAVVFSAGSWTRSEESEEEAARTEPEALEAPPEPAAPAGGEARQRLGSLGFGRRARPPKEKKEKKERAAGNERRAKERRAKRVVGLKIGASQIVAAEVVNNGAPELVDVFREPLESGIVVSGEIRDAEALGFALKRLFELHGLPKRGVRLGLANNRIGVRIFEIEGVSDLQQLDNAIRFRAEEVLPIPLDEAVLDYVVLEDAVREDGTPWKRILVVVAYREVVDRYLQACRSAGLEVVGIDLEAFALLRAVEAPTDRGTEGGALVAVAIGHDRTTIAVSTGRRCEFTRVLDWGGWSLNIAIARELDKAPSEVESLKRRLSFASATEVDGYTPEQIAKAREAIQRSLSGFVRELVASLQFYQAQPGALGIGEVVLTGGATEMEGLPEALGELVGVPIRVGDPFKRVKVGPKVTHDGPRGSLSVAIGLGIED